MRRLQKILFIGYMICSSPVLSQVMQAEYFFDNDLGEGNGTAISITPGESLDGSFAADASGLAPGFHRLFVRVKDDKDNWGLFEGRTFYVQDNSSSVTSTQVVEAEYFFDTDPGEGNGTAITFISGDNLDVAFAADASGLSTGFHRLFVRVKDDLGNWGLFEGRTFYIQSTATGTLATQVAAAEYFIDNDPGVGAGTSIDITAPSGEIDQQISIDITGFETGFHRMFIRVQDDRGLWSLEESRTFYVQDASNESAATIVAAAEYFFDDDPGIGSGTAISLTATEAEIQESIALASTGLAEGTHTLFIRVKDDRGIWSLYQSGDITVTNGPLSNDGFVTTDEDTALTFAEADFNYSSSGGTTFSRVRINSLPLNGNLLLDGSSVSVDQEILVSDLPNFTYNPDTNVSGEDAFEFTVGDASALSVASSIMNIDVMMVNDAPEFTLSGDVIVDQDFASTQTITVTPATVPSDEVDQVVTYSIDPASVTFANVSIDSNTGTVSITSVADEFGTQVFTVTADDGGATNNTASSTFTLTVNPSNASPIIEDQAFELAENPAEGEEVGTVTASDPEGDALTFAITDGNDAGGFSLDSSSGVISVSDGSVLDFETTASFILTVEVSDGTTTSSAIVTVNLTDVAEAPLIADQTFEIVENSTQGSEVGTVVASDSDGDVLTYSITAGNEAGGFALDASSGVLSVDNGAVLDFETSPSFSLTIEVSDGSLSASAVVTVNLTDVADNQSPEITDQTFEIAENSTQGIEVGTIVASDPDEDALTFAITAGNDAGGFTLDAGSGALTVSDETVLDFETTPTFSLTVEVSDGVLSASATITVNLTDVEENEAPTISDQTFEIAENSEQGTEIGAVVASDLDGDVLTFAITAGNDAGGFALDAGTGVLTVSDEAVLDFETTPSFGLTVQVSDGVLSASAIVTINLIDVAENEAPTIANQTFEVTENSTQGTEVGVIVASDPNEDELTYAIVDGNNEGGFALNETSGILTVNDGSVLDFESNSSFSLIVEVSDGSLSSSATITVNILDEEEALGLEELGIIIYPNPTNGVFKIRYQNQVEIIHIVNVAGKKVNYLLDERGNEGIVIDMQKASEGVYFMNLLIDGTIRSVKISKEN